MKYEFQHNVIILNIITRICEPSVWESLSKQIQNSGLRIKIPACQNKLIIYL